MSIDSSGRGSISRREALVSLASFLASSPLLQAQQDPSPLALHRRAAGFSEMFTPWDFEPVFRANVPKAVYDYTVHGTDSEFTLRRNREAFDWVKLNSVGGPISKNLINTSLILFGKTLSTPLMLAPTARQRPLHSDGELAMYEAATRADQTMIVSHASSFPFDRVAKASTGPLWFQFYPRPDRSLSEQILVDAQTAGALAIVVTIDQQASSYERALHNRHLGGAPRSAKLPSRNDIDNPYGVRSGRLWYDWNYLSDIRPMVSVPLLAKGILTAEGARRCVDLGFDGIVVSNHGGRALDYGPSTIEVLQEIVTALDGRIPVIIDSGFRRGSDVVKALALGATAVCLGRVPRWGLGAFGIDGAHRVLEMVQAELIHEMSRIGCRSLDEINGSSVTTEFF